MSVQNPNDDVLIVALFRYDHQERLSAKEAMAHAYFAPVREAAVRGAAQGSNSGYAV